jgi:hypothetical protein
MGYRSPQTRFVLAVLVAIAGLASVVSHADARVARAATTIDFDAAPLGKAWLDASSFGPWHSLHDGFGVTRVERAGDVRVLALRTRAPQRADETFSSLVHTRRSFGDIDFGVTVHTAMQLRKPAANPWEVGWILWRYKDNRHFYSFIVKPNGWELAKQDASYRGSQRFLAVSYDRAYPVGRSYRLRVRHVGNMITVWVDGARVVRYTDGERPYRSGAIALYAEDALARYSVVSLHPLR